MIYRAYGRSIESDHPLPELEAADAARAEFRVVWDARVHVPAGASWTTLWRFSDGEPWVTVARTSSARHLRFGRFAEFRVSDGLIEIAPRGRVAVSTLRHLLLDQALPLALAASGALVLHASAVCVGGRAVLFIGEAGSGKSTLAALLARRGCPVLADDGVLLEQSAGGIRAVPSYPGLRLFPDPSAAALIDQADAEVAEYTRKRRILAAADPGLFRASPAPVGRAYMLSPGGETAFERLSMRDAAMAIVQHAYRVDIEERTELEAQLNLIARSASALDVWRLTYPRSWATAADVSRAIAAHAAAAAP